MLDALAEKANIVIGAAPAAVIEITKTKITKIIGTVRSQYATEAAGRKEQNVYEKRKRLKMRVLLLDQRDGEPSLPPGRRALRSEQQRRRRRQR